MTDRMRTLELLKTAPGNAVAYSEAAWAVARKGPQGGSEAQWFPDQGASRAPSMSAAELAAWTSDWVILAAPAQVLRDAADRLRREAGADECAMHDVARESQLPRSSQIMLNGVTRAAERIRSMAADRITGGTSA